jgi:hypothetical protein
MKEAARGNGPVVAIRHERPRRPKKGLTHRCSICASRVWVHPVHLTEPEGVPEPRLSWTLCRPCYRALMKELRRSPVRSPLRLRIAMGLVASERWPQAYSTRARLFVSDRRWIVFIAVSFVVAMLVHLVLIVMIAQMMH